MVRRAASNGARRAGRRKLDAAADRGAVGERPGQLQQLVAEAARGSGTVDQVQSITTFWAPKPDHSTKQTAIRWCGPERIASITCGSEIAAA